MRLLRAATILAILTACAAGPVQANPANRIALIKYYGKFLSKSLGNCTTCHLPLQPGKTGTSLADFPHNPFGNRLRILGDALRRQGKKADIPTRLRMIAHEDSDGDGVDNQTELLVGTAPGDAKEKPDRKLLAQAPRIKAEFAKYLAGYRWQPFDTVQRPPLPRVKNAAWVRNPIDSFIAAEHEARGLKPRPEASRDILLRRVYIDLIGLAPTPTEIRAFESDLSPDAYEKVVDKLLASPRYGERWGRHWMDVWRYSDWAGWSDGGQIRDSKPHIWRWRDWIVESLNKDKGYDRMVQEMLAADELCPEDPDALRATGFLVRNFKLLSREQWMEDTLNHTSRAFMGVTMHCSKCHDHMYDPVSQEEYYRLRAIFEPHNVRTDRIPGQPDTAKDGLVHAFDAEPKAATYFFVRGDERNPDKSKVIAPGTPAALGGRFEVQPVSLPRTAYAPDKRDFVIQETMAVADKTVADTEKGLQDPGNAPPEKHAFADLNHQVAVTRRDSLLAVLKVERLEDSGDKSSDAWKQAATAATAAQRNQAVVEAKFNLLNAQKILKDAEPGTAGKSGKPVETKPLKAKVDEAEKALAKAESDMKAPPATAYKPRIDTVYPAESTGRRLAFARWLTDLQNPLTARVAVNHIWMRHFGQGIVPSASDFGRNGRPPTHPQLLDWLAAELMNPTMDGRRKTEDRIRNAETERRTPNAERPITQSPNYPITQNPTPWAMKRLHRLLVTSATYRMASTPDESDARIDPDNNFLWRMSSRRMEAEVVRDNVLYAAGQIDETMGGPDIDQNLALTSKRRSIYLRIAAEKESEFLKTFDGPSVSECYERKPSVVPQQALALANSQLTIEKSKLLAAALTKEIGPSPALFIQESFLRILSRRPTAPEIKMCLQFLTDQAKRITPEPGVKTVAALPDDKNKPDSALRARENLILVLFNHNDFVTVR